MLTALETWKRELAEEIKARYGIEVPGGEVVITFPPKPGMGDVATPAAFLLAKVLHKSPASIARELASVQLAGIREVKVAGGYLNFYVDRAWALSTLLSGGFIPEAAGGKVIVEHTNINPNKAAHVGHLRNAVLGDTFVRCLRYLGRKVEVQNYIDDTGVQVADVVVGFQRILGWDLKRVGEATGGVGGVLFDSFCWNLYAKVAPWYEENDPEKEARRETLALMEEGNNDTAEMAAIIAEAMVCAHLKTMERIAVRYDLLPHESDILKAGFWSACFGKLEVSGAVRRIPEDSEEKNRGCRVMALSDAEEFKGMSDADKVIVRSNGTVTYIGKDMAYQLWKFGLLGRDFHYRRYRTPGYDLWRTDASSSDPGAPSFGGGYVVYNVIDVRQSYLQKVVKEGLRRMGHQSEAARSIHFSYEMVALSSDFVRSEMEKGASFPGLDEADLAKPYVEMSGRKGLGFQADALLDRMEEHALREIEKREASGGTDPRESEVRAKAVAAAALRYYMVKQGRNQVVAFDLKKALAFEGDTGPYLQYACVRAENILRKAKERGFKVPALDDAYGQTARRVSAMDEEGWELLTLFLRVPVVVKSAVDSLDLNLVSNQYHEAARAFHAYYHAFPVLQEADETKREARLLTVALFARFFRGGLENLLGIHVPERM